jgi:glycosyltransferase involved in cell wall biosynthesis
MKIVYVHNFYKNPGGEDQVFKAESELLVKHDHSVITFISSYKKLKKVFHNFKPDLVHFHNIFPLISPSAYYACSKSGITVIQTLHNYRLICPAATLMRKGAVCEKCVEKLIPWPSIVHRCYRNSYLQTTAVALMIIIHRFIKTWEKKVDIYIALTEFSREKFIKGGLPSSKIMIKPNFYYPEPKRLSKHRKYALFVGRLSKEKGLITLLKAWQNLKNIPLKIVGDGPLYDNVLRASKKSKNIEVLGYCPHNKVMELLKNARVLIFPSEWYEGLPMIIIEAFASGVPVLASKLGAMSEIINDKCTGLLFNLGDTYDLADKVIKFWSNDEQANKMSKEARLEFESKYNADRNYQLIIDLYQKVRRNQKMN